MTAPPSPRLRTATSARLWRAKARWVVFNLVGVLGFVVQLGALTVMLHAGWPYLIATVLAVEAAILHNFAWHERWTWRDRPACGRERLARLRRFHLLNGLISLGGNVALMALLYGLVGLPALVASTIAIVACSLVNYFASELAVFTMARDARDISRPAGAERPDPPTARSVVAVPR
jgi:putative flippase GtrA